MHLFRNNREAVLAILHLERNRSGLFNHHNTGIRPVVRPQIFIHADRRRPVENYVLDPVTDMKLDPVLQLDKGKSLDSRNTFVLQVSVFIQTGWRGSRRNPDGANRSNKQPCSSSTSVLHLSASFIDFTFGGKNSAPS